MNRNLIQDISSVEKADEYFVGEKAVHLADLKLHGFTIPKSFVITRQACKLFFKENNLQLKIKHLLASVNFNDPNSVSQVSQAIKQMIESCPIPSEIFSQFFSLFEKEKIKNVVILPSDTQIHQTNSQPFKLQEAQGESSALQVIKSFWALSYSSYALSQMHESGKEIQESALVMEEVINPEKSGVLYTSVKNDEYEYVKIQAVLGNNISVDLGNDEYLIKKPSALYSDTHPNLRS